MLANLLNMTLPGSWKDTLCCTDREKDAAAASAGKVAGKPVFPQPRAEPAQGDAPDSSAAADLEQTVVVERGGAKGAAAPADDDPFLQADAPEQSGSQRSGGRDPAAGEARASAGNRSPRATDISLPPAEASLGAVVAVQPQARAAPSGQKPLQSLHERMRQEELQEVGSISSDSSLEEGLNDCRAKIKVQLRKQEELLRHEERQHRGHPRVSVLDDISMSLQELDGKMDEPQRNLTAARQSQGSDPGEVTEDAQRGYQRGYSKRGLSRETLSSADEGTHVETEEGANAAQPRLSVASVASSVSLSDQWDERKRALQQRVGPIFGDTSLTNDDDDPVYLDSIGSGLYHCGRPLPEGKTCGPPNGDQCASCKRLDIAMKDARAGGTDVHSFQARMQEKLGRIGDPEQVPQLDQTADVATAVKNAILTQYERNLETQQKTTADGTDYKDIMDDELEKLEKQLEMLRGDGVNQGRHDQDGRSASVIVG